MGGRNDVRSYNNLWATFNINTYYQQLNIRKHFYTAFYSFLTVQYLKKYKNVHIFFAGVRNKLWRQGEGKNIELRNIFKNQLLCRREDWVEEFYRQVPGLEIILAESIFAGHLIEVVGSGEVGHVATSCLRVSCGSVPKHGWYKGRFKKWKKY